MTDLYYEKYLKYKNKYLSLKNSIGFTQYGGAGRGGGVIGLVKHVLL